MFLGYSTRCARWLQFVLILMFSCYFLLLVLERAFCLSVRGARAGIGLGQYGAPPGALALGTNDIDAGRAPVELGRQRKESPNCDILRL